MTKEWSRTSARSRTSFHTSSPYDSFMKSCRLSHSRPYIFLPFPLSPTNSSEEAVVQVDTWMLHTDSLHVGSSAVGLCHLLQKRRMNERKEWKVCVTRINKSCEHKCKKYSMFTVIWFDIKGIDIKSQVKSHIPSKSWPVLLYNLSLCETTLWLPSSDPTLFFLKRPATHTNLWTSEGSYCPADTCQGQVTERVAQHWRSSEVTGTDRLRPALRSTCSTGESLFPDRLW